MSYPLLVQMWQSHRQELAFLFLTLVPYNFSKGLSNVTCYEKIDHLQFFINLEFLAHLVSSVCAKYIGESLKIKS